MKYTKPKTDEELLAALAHLPPRDRVFTAAIHLVRLRQAQREASKPGAIGTNSTPEPAPVQATITQAERILEHIVEECT